MTPIEWTVAHCPKTKSKTRAQETLISQVCKVVEKHGPVSLVDISFRIGRNCQPVIKWARERGWVENRKVKERMVWTVTDAYTLESGLRTQTQTLFARIREQSKDMESGIGKR